MTEGYSHWRSFAGDDDEPEPCDLCGHTIGHAPTCSEYDHGVEARIKRLEERVETLERELRWFKPIGGIGPGPGPYDPGRHSR